MSGQPNRKPSDLVKFRQDYLDNLAEQIQNNISNEQAVKLYKETQQVMPISQIKDTRTTSEKLLDMEKLKINFIKDLEPIAEPMFASQLVQGLLQSPLNNDNKLFIFAAQTAPDLVEKLKKMYKYGIRGDINDVEQFVSFINKYYQDKRTITDNARSFSSRIGSSDFMSSGALETLKKKGYEIASNLVSLLKDVKELFPSINTISLQKEFKHVLQLLPDENIRKIIEYVVDINTQKMPFADSIMSQIKNYLNYLNYNLPNYDMIATLTKELYIQILQAKKSSSSSDFQKQKIENIIETIRDQLSFDEQEAVNAHVARAEIQKFIVDNYKGGMPSPEQLGRDYIQQGRRGRVEEVEPEGKEERMQLEDQAPDDEFFDLPEQNTFVSEELKPKKESSDRFQEYFDIKGPKTKTKKKKEVQSDMFQDYFDIKEPKPKGKGFRMHGCGLPFESKVDKSQGIDASPRYIKFGRYVINNKKLHDNVVSLRRPKGSSISNLKTFKTSSELGRVIKTIVGGGSPSFEDLNSLTDEEKRYLYKVSQEADIYDKVKIPTPSKDQEEKDVHQFNVMKGEIMAGNNSKELVHKFKLLLLKLSKSNILPKNQVNEIMEELLELGF